MKKNSEPRTTLKLAAVDHDLVLAQLRDAGRPLRSEDLAAALGLVGAAQRTRLDALLGELSARGAVVQNRAGAYALPERLDLIAGVVLANADGFGFLRPDAGGEDIYLAPSEMRRVYHGDRAMVAITGLDRRQRPQGRIVEVIARRAPRLVGRYLEEGRIGRVVPDDPRLQHELLIPREQAADAKPGDVVVAEIVEPPAEHRLPLGRILRVVGSAIGTTDIIDVVIDTHLLPREFPAEVQREAAAIPERLTPEQLDGRVDLRELPLVTIDGEDARDFDDAVYAERVPSGFRLWVAIADVASYVRPDSALDREAQRRGTSVYFPQRVLPMLPEKLSNGLCSLRPEEDRLCLVADLLIDPQGRTRRSRFYRAVIRSARRLTYTQVARALNRAPATGRSALGASQPNLEVLDALYRVLARARHERGALEFEGREVRFGFDEQGEIASVERYQRNDAHRLIEECMIAANVAAARFLQKARIPALYRVHAPPPAGKLEDLREFLAELGIALPEAEDLSSLDLARLLAKARSRPDFPLIEAVILRAQSLAIYHESCSGHFGLALPAYAHFTSPIRRYPDLLVHRAIHHVLDGGRAHAYRYSAAEMAELGRACSAAERRADEASREVDERMKCRWIERHLGAVFEAVVTGVSSFGAFVELLDNGVGGLIHVTQLPEDYYHFDPIQHCLVGERTRGALRLADRLRVAVLRVDPVERKVDFRPVDELPRHTGRALPPWRRDRRAGRRR